MSWQGGVPTFPARGGFVFSGLGFEFSGLPEALLPLAALEGVVQVDASQFRPLCQVQVAVQRARAAEWCSSGELDRAIRWSWSGGCCSIDAPRAAIELDRVDGGYRARAVVAPGPLPLSAVLAGIASAVVQDRGGVVLHCASVLWRGSIIGFVGPSGAGKSTACMHIPSAPLYSIDRLAVFPDESGGYRAAAMPGGTVPEASLALAPTAQSHPLRALYFLGANRRSTRVLSVPNWRKVAALRQNTLDGQLGAAAAGELLETLVSLARAVSVACLQLRLGDDLTPWLARLPEQNGAPHKEPMLADGPATPRDTSSAWAK